MSYRRDVFGPVYSPAEIEAMHEGIHRRLRGLVEIAEGMDESDPDRLAEKAWLIGTVQDVTAWFDMQDAAIRRASIPAKYPTLDDRNPASVVGVPWNEEGYAGEESTPAMRSYASGSTTEEE